MYIAAPAAIGVLILTVIVILVLFAICFKVRKKTRTRNQISVSYLGTDTVHYDYVTNADVINFKTFDVCVDPNIIYEELPEFETDFSQDSEDNTYTSMDVENSYISMDVK